MSDICELIKKNRIYFDGGLGTMLQKCGLSSGELPENWNLEHPEIIEDIHRQYLQAGANIITTNTFGVNCLKHENYRELIKAAIACAKRAAREFDDSFIAFDIGPLGRFLQPIGYLPFEDAVEIFAKNIRVAKECGVDLLIIETMTDSYETKAAVIAAKETCDLPIFVTNVYDENGKMLTGANPEAMIAMLEGLGVAAIGMNCSLGPDKMLPLMSKFRDNCSLPIIVNPNAGLPEMVDGKAVYSMTAERFADYAVELAKAGASILGGCCGTDPSYIKAVVQKTKNIPLPKIEKKNFTVVSSYTHAVKIDAEPVLIGERINPTGKPRFKQALRDSDINYILEQGLIQADQGVHILDINVGLPEINEIYMMKNVVSSLQAICDLPLQLDSNDSVVLEASMRIYNGKPLINSVNGDDESMERIFPLVKKYGGTVVALTLDKNGIPKCAEDRVKIAKRIIERASQYGIDKNDLIFDPLTMAISTDTDSAKITLMALKMLNDMGLKTCLGVSNISFGLPNREKINSAFFKLALFNGLSCAIMNPSSQEMMNVYADYQNILKNGALYEEFQASLNYQDEIPKYEIKKETSLKDLIIRGMVDLTVQRTAKALNSSAPLNIITNEIIPALDEVGDSFEKQKIYLPQLLMSAECASKAFALVKEKMPVSESNGKSVIIATVKGDIHDIGKNIVKLMLESYGFTVYDLGKDVSKEAILGAVKKCDCKLVALSALMTTTLPAMQESIELLHAYDSSIKVMVGGAVLTEEYARMIGADAYGKDAMAAVKYAEQFYRQDKADA